jgi:hypothetical protein
MPSSIPGAGLGLVATKNIPEGTLFCEYKGRAVHPDDLGDSTYAAEMPNSSDLLLVGDRATSFGPFANDCRDDQLVNAKLQWEGTRCMLVSTEVILHGSDVLLDYGLDYWAVRLHLLPPDLREATERRLAQRAARERPTAADLALIAAPSAPNTAARPTTTDPFEDDHEGFRLGTDEPEAPNDDDGSTDKADDEWFRTRGVDDIMRWVQEFFPELAPEREEVRELLQEAHDLGSAVFGHEAANTWAKGFRMPEAAVREDDDLWLACRGNFQDMVREKLRRVMAADRISEDRVHACLSDANPHKEVTFLQLVREGISLCTPDSYTGCGSNMPALGKTFTDTAAPVEKMMFNSYWEEGLSIILTESRVRTLDSLGLCIASWARKAGKECGRPITNGSGRRGMPEAEYMNGPATKAAAMELYGGTHNTDIGKVCRMVTGFAARRRVLRDRLRLWAFDLAAAYGKISYGPRAAQHVGVELRDGRFMFFIGGVFGLTSMPFAFNVITQAIVWELNHKRLEGDMDQFVDDGIVISLDVEEEEDIRLARFFLNGLLGPKAIAEHKFMRCPVIIFIGYQMSITTWLVSVSRRNILKAIYAFGMVDLTPNALIPVKKIQQLASLGSRYGYICHTIRPFVRVLYTRHTRVAHGCEPPPSPPRLEP